MFSTKEITFKFKTGGDQEKFSFSGENKTEIVKGEKKKIGYSMTFQDNNFIVSQHILTRNI